MIPLTEVAETLGLELTDGGFIGMKVLTDARGNEARVYRLEPKKYSFNRFPRAVEFPYIQFDQDEELHVPVGMFNSLCRDFGRIDAIITGQGTKVDRPYRDHVKLDAPDPGSITRPEPAASQPAKAKSATTALASTLSGWTIVVDAGHGGKDPGGIGVAGVQEKEIALNTAFKVGKMLEAQGATVVYTRTNDTFIELAERAAIANRKRADLFISIHANIASSEAASGIETWYSDGNERGKMSASLADAVNKGMVAETKAVDRGARADQRGLRVLRSTDMPAVLVELGFMSNTAESRKLVQSDYQDKLARGIVTGVRRHVAAVPRVEPLVSR
jgi:N-acetylmuramoyl-L-alanine amidase